MLCARYSKNVAIIIKLIEYTELIPYRLPYVEFVWSYNSYIISTACAFRYCCICKLYSNNHESVSVICACARQGDSRDV